MTTVVNRQGVCEGMYAGVPTHHRGGKKEIDKKRRGEKVIMPKHTKLFSYGFL